MLICFIKSLLLTNFQGQEFRFINSNVFIVRLNQPSEIKNDADTLKAEKRRVINKKIRDNVGLKRYRSKKFKNARTKLREKTRRKKIKLNGLIKNYKHTEGNYKGELTGIKSHLIRSTSLKD